MQLLYALAKLRTPFLDTVLGALTNCGGEIVFMAVAIIVFWCVSKSCGYYMLTVGFVGTIVNQFLKLVFRIPRPWVKDPNFQIVESARAEATGYSFPSAAVIVLTAFSRMYLGVHTPLDVGVSFGLGLVLVFALYPLFRDIDSHPNRLYWLFGVMAVLGLAYLLFAELWPFPADVDAANLASGRKNAYTLLGAVLGMTFSYWLDRRYVHFDVRAVWWAQVLKAVLGLAITIGLRTVLKAPLLALCGGHNIANLIRYALMVIFAAGIWPMTFGWFGRLGRNKPVPGTSD